MKYKILKAVDVAGLNFLSPVIRLCYGEEPDVQIRKIMQMIVIPVVAIIAFIGLWYVISEEIQTKSGKLPDPGETFGAASDIGTFASREDLKEWAFELDGKQREAELTKVQARLVELDPLLAEANEQVESVKAEHESSLKALATPIEQKYDALKAQFKEDKAARMSELKAEAEALQAGSRAGHDAFLLNVRKHQAKLEEESQALKVLKGEKDEVYAAKSAAVAQALKAQTKVAEEKQFLVKMEEQLTKANRANKLAGQTEKVDSTTEKFYGETGASALSLARKIVKSEQVSSRIEQADYAKPATLTYQVKRSLLCVFTGFVIGTAIAIPIGILCGLSSTFMAAMTPFIAIFKPVSPIVWLPIALIIVGGIIPDPDQHPFILWMWELPFLGDYKINPAFIASAVTVALCSLWATLVNTALGVASIDKDHLNVARVLKLGFASRLFRIVIPSALPLIFAGLRISLGVGWMVLIAAELLSSSEGIGKFVWDQFNNGASDSFAKLFVVVFVVGIIGLVLDRIMIVFQRLVSFDGAPTAI